MNVYDSARLHVFSCQVRLTPKSQQRPKMEFPVVTRSYQHEILRGQNTEPLYRLFKWRQLSSYTLCGRWLACYRRRLNYPTRWDRPLNAASTTTTTTTTTTVTCGAKIVVATITLIGGIFRTCISVSACRPLEVPIPFGRFGVCGLHPYIRKGNTRNHNAQGRKRTKRFSVKVTAKTKMFLPALNFKF